MYTYRLQEVTFKSGLQMPLENLTVIVGPNNAGKSRALRDILGKTTKDIFPKGTVVTDVKWTMPTSVAELRQSYDVERYLDDHNRWCAYALNPDLTTETCTIFNKVWPEEYQNIFQVKNPEKQFTLFFGKSMVAYVGTEQRLQMVKQSISPEHDRQVASLLQALYVSGRDVENRIRSIIKGTFGVEIILDYSMLRELVVRVGQGFDQLPSDPREMRTTMLKCAKLDEYGDGIRSFVGILVALFALKRSVFLIDEPEAFLHPPQAFRIGELIAEQCNNNKQILVATHSADVLRGILNKTKHALIVRLDRDGDINSASALDPAKLRELVTDPLLSSSRVLDGLFYSGAIVVEADSDARFYHSASKKLKPDLDAHFVNADNKQTVPRIVGLYKELGIRTAGIVDFDVLNNRNEFSRQLEILGMPSQEMEACLAAQQKISDFVGSIPASERIEQVKQLFDGLYKTLSTSPLESETENLRLLTRIERGCAELSDATKAWRKLKTLGRLGLPPELQEAFDSLSARCAKMGLFINPTGELESMLSEYGLTATTDKRGWIRLALNLLPQLEADPKKLPWAFVEQIHDHLHTTIATREAGKDGLAAAV